jgi:hypothetical protein
MLYTKNSWLFLLFDHFSLQKFNSPQVKHYACAANLKLSKNWEFKHNLAMLLTSYQVSALLTIHFTFPTLSSLVIR